MDKSWMKKPRFTKEYKEGVSQFLDFASRNASVDGKILCPCKHCKNLKPQSYEEARTHLVCKGFLDGYTFWFIHNEKSLNPVDSSSNYANDMRGNYEVEAISNSGENLDDMDGLLCDLFMAPNQVDSQQLGDNEHLASIEESTPMEQLSNNSEYELISNLANQPLYEGCETHSRLSFILHLFHLKCMHGWTIVGFNDNLKLMRDILPKEALLPSSFYEANKIIKTLGLGYEKIHVCPNDCMLYRGSTSGLDSCHICGASRWASNDRNGDTRGSNEGVKYNKTRKIPAKILRYFPLIPRLKRLFMSSNSSKDMRWHEQGRRKDGLLRHPADGEAWKSFDEKFSDFASDPRNVRLALTTDGFNPFNTMSKPYSIWPILLTVYNLPPWISMKQHSFILSMLIPGPESPGNDIDIFLEPLIEELKLLWDGVETFDALTGKCFNMKAMLMWTINDFLAYGNLSGWSTKGRYACPICMDSTTSEWLSHGGKFCYMGHRRWLPCNHHFRRQKRCFDGNNELKVAPKRLSGEDVLKQLDGREFLLGKNPMRKKKKRLDAGKRKRNASDHYTFDKRDPRSWWKKKTIFFNLPYWKHNLLRHNLDIMHIEKNVCDNILGTFLNLGNKSKDNVKAGKDLKEIGIRPELHIQLDDKGKEILPPASFTMSNKEKEILCQVIKDLKTPDGYGSNLSSCVNLEERKIFGLKSHDCHILIQTILPLVLRYCLQSHHVIAIVVEIGGFFKALCARVLDPKVLDKMQERVILAFCQMEKIFPPSFFTIMVHLIIHLVDEAKLSGPVQYTWMYPYERSFLRFKNYVHNRARPEGSIAEGYIADECLSFCSKYLVGVKTRFNRPSRNPEPEESGGQFLFSSFGKPIGGHKFVTLTDMEWQQAQRYVLRHCDHLESLRDEFIVEEMKLRGRRTEFSANDKFKILNDKFHIWLRNRVMRDGDIQITNEVITLGLGPLHRAESYSGLTRDGFRFLTKHREQNLKTQNSGVVNKGEEGDILYYGKIVEIIELNYMSVFKVILFKCEWVNVHSSAGMRKDEFGHTSVNFSNLIHTGKRLKDDPYVFSSQVEQVFYVQDPTNPNWSTVVRVKPRDLFDMGVEAEKVDDVGVMHPDINNFDCGENPTWIRMDIDAEEYTAAD